MNIKLSDAEVKKSFDKQRKQQFPKDADYKKFLKDSGQSEEDILQRVRLELLSNKIRDKIVKGKDKVTDQQIKAYYDKNRQRFSQPETRDLRIVLTRTRRRPSRPRRRSSPATPGRRSPRSTRSDQASKAQGGKLDGVAKGTQEKSLDAAIFGAKEGKLTGPSRRQFGYYVFEVDKVKKADQQTLQEATPTIKQLLSSQGQQKALDKFVKDFRSRWQRQDRVPGGLQDHRLQERPEGDPDAHAGRGRPAGAPAARAGPGPGPAAAAGRPAAAAAAAALGPGCGRPSMSAEAAADAVARLDALTRRLRRECPWDREQDERTIVPHTVEEAYELAAAAHAGDDGKLLDELGDVLFQVHFLALLLEERGAGSLAEVAEHVREKLIRRHPHVFGEEAAEGDTEQPREVLANWDAIKRTEPGREGGLFGEVPENLPGPLYARKVQRRAASSGFDFDRVPYEAVRGELDELEAADGPRGALPRGRRRAVRRRQRRAQAAGRPGAGAARRVRALPRPRRGRRRSRRTRTAPTGTISRPTRSCATTLGPASPRRRRGPTRHRLTAAPSRARARGG